MIHHIVLFYTELKSLSMSDFYEENFFFLQRFRKSIIHPPSLHHWNLHTEQEPKASNRNVRINETIVEKKVDTIPSQWVGLYGFFLLFSFFFLTIVIVIRVFHSQWSTFLSSNSKYIVRVQVHLSSLRFRANLVLSRFGCYILSILSMTLHIILDPF